MKNSGYDAFFKAAKESKKSTPQKRQKSAKRQSSSTAGSKKRPIDEYSEQELRKIFNMPSSKNNKLNKRKQPTPFKIPLGGLVLTTTLIFLSGGFILFPDSLESLLPKIRWSIFAKASAEGQEKTATKEPGQVEKNSSPGKEEESQEKKGHESWSKEDISYFSKLNERKTELDLREKELGELEQELNKQKAEIEARIKYLEQVRENIALVLKDRVDVDEKKVEKLVQFYSNMKPGQAAQIISGINEELAIGVLSRMKKKNAAAILNLIESKKAKRLSEKFAGYIAQ